MSYFKCTLNFKLSSCSINQEFVTLSQVYSLKVTTTLPSWSLTDIVSLRPEASRGSKIWPFGSLSCESTSVFLRCSLITRLATGDSLQARVSGVDYCPLHHLGREAALAAESPSGEELRVGVKMSPTHWVSLAVLGGSEIQTDTSIKIYAELLCC